MIIKPENIKIVFKCHDCNALCTYDGKYDDLSTILSGLHSGICEQCGDGELELSHFETI